MLLLYKTLDLSEPHGSCQTTQIIIGNENDLNVCKLRGIGGKGWVIQVIIWHDNKCFRDGEMEERGHIYHPRLILRIISKDSSQFQLLLWLSIDSKRKLIK